MRNFPGICQAAILAFPLYVSGWASAQGSTATPADEKAIAIVDHMRDVIGNASAWEKVTYLRFDFVVDREGKTVADFRHLWDLKTGRYRVEGKDGADAFIILLDVRTKQGKAFVNGAAASEEQSAKFLEEGYGRFINDTYWLLMPHKLRDPGVHLAYEGEQKSTEGAIDDVVHVSFDKGVGLTPGDQYWAYVSRETGLMERWRFVLEGPDARKGEFSWSEWRSYGPVMLSSEKTSTTSPVRIWFRNLGVLEAVPERVFDDPTVPMPNE